ncbi:MAG: hypothetical protein KBA48_03895 [Niveispirillum sp.]|nr:hypothetical protein [Niveispirillum sp.]
MTSTDVTNSTDAHARPDHVPVKFWDPATGGIRVEALLKSYQELERKMSGPTDPAAEKAKALALLGVPDKPDGYCIRCDHGLFEPDAEINNRLHGAGYTPEQAQLLYDLAAERMLPLLQEMAAGYQAEAELEKLASHFGGPEKWQELSGQILAWGQRNLPSPLLDALSGTADGVMALHRLMGEGGGEPKALRRGADSDATGGVGDLNRMIADPRYWRDRDPGFIAKVTEGFRRAYGNG